MNEPAHRHRLAGLEPDNLLAFLALLGLLRALDTGPARLASAGGVGHRSATASPGAADDQS